MYIADSQEMNILVPKNNFYNLKTDRNSTIRQLTITEKGGFSSKKTTNVKSKPYLRIVEEFNTNYYDINILKENYINTVHYRGFIEPNCRARFYWKKSWVKNDERGNNTYLFENPDYLVIENIDRQVYKDILPPKNHKMYPLYPIKACVTFLIDKETVLFNNAYTIKIEEENRRGDKFSYMIKIDDSDFIKLKEQMNYELKDFNTNLSEDSW